MSGKLIKALVAIVVVAFAAAYLGSPVLASQALVKAAKAGDEAALDRLVDFPAFRTSLKEELNARLVAEMRADLGDNDRGNVLSGLGMILAPSLISGAVDAFVNAPAIASMVRTAEAPATTPTGRVTPPPAEKATDEDKVRRSYGYRDLNTFVVTLRRDDKPNEQVDLLMQRRGLFAWKLAGIDLTPPTE